MPRPETVAHLHRALDASREPPSFLPLTVGIRDALASEGVAVERVQLPMSRLSGFRHPTYGLVLATWADDTGFDGSEVLTHAALDRIAGPGVAKTPFAPIVLEGVPHILRDLGHDTGGFATLERLRARGFRGHCALGLPLPGGDNQPLSVCSRRPFTPAQLAAMVALRPLLAMVVYAAYRSSQALRVAEAYIGRVAGPRVLAGEIQRGSTQRVEAGIVFCDIRGFTPLSDSLGAEQVVALVNEIFAAVEAEAAPRGGEILKFIGDAMLIVFAGGGDRARLAAAMVETAAASLAAVAALGHGVRIGFGGHIGEVVQGNIGTPTRLDFTVMGPAVNLASRLEGLSKPLGVGAAFSGAVGEALPGRLAAAGPQRVKGLADPVAVWVLGAPAAAEDAPEAGLRTRGGPG